MTATLLYSWACKHKRAANMCCEIIDVQDGKLRRGACIVPNMVWLTRNGGWITLGRGDEACDDEPLMRAGLAAMLERAAARCESWAEEYRHDAEEVQGR